MSDLKCPHCGKQPDDAIEYALEDCKANDAFEVLTACDHCNGEIGIAVSKEAYVNRRDPRHSNAELEKMRAAKISPSQPIEQAAVVSSPTESPRPPEEKGK